MEREQIISRLQPVFDQLFLQPVKLIPSLSAADVKEWDSLLQVSIVLAVEQEFGIRFRVGEVEKTKNVGEFAGLIATRLQKR